MRTPAYNEGQLAAANGHEQWQNPYSGPDSRREDFHDWFRGWCAGQLALAKKWAQATRTTSCGKAQ